MNIIGILLIFWVMTTQVYGEENPRFYLGKTHSLVDWANLDTNDFLDYDLFADELKKRDVNPNFERELRDSKIYERAGLVLSCVGICDLLKGEGKNKLKYLSTVREGDEVITEKDSYLWLYLLDGTLVRLSPETSFTLNEINIGKKKNFLFARLNYGNALWLSRDKGLFTVKNKRETDRLFLPLPLRAANQQKSSDLPTLYTRLNDYIKKNNQFVTKITQAFIVMPNGSVEGDSISGEFISLFNGKSYFKLRDYEQLGLMSKRTVQNNATFYYRGHNKVEGKKVDTSKWYEVTRSGDEIRDSESTHFSLGEFPTSRIPSLYLAREYMLAEYSLFAYSTLSRKALGEAFGYRLWLDKERTKRLDFIRSYTRRLETTQLKVLQSFWQKQKNLESEEYSNKYFSAAMSSYATKWQSPRQLSQKRVLLNSEKKPFWNVVNEK